MASKSEPQAEAAAAEVEDAVVKVEQPAAEQVEAEAGEDAEQVEEPQVEADEPETEAPVEAGDPLPSHVLMKQADGGSCDAYESDKDGNHLVPVGDIEVMASHGFEVVGTAA